MKEMPWLKRCCRDTSKPSKCFSWLPFQLDLCSAPPLVGPEFKVVLVAALVASRAVWAAG